MGVTRLGNNLSPASPPVADLLKLLEPISADLQRVEQLLAQQVSGFEPGVRGQIQYLLTGSGKRLRPALALLAAGATGRIEERHLMMGVIVELIHLATLVHDDVLDEADLRHSQPTANARWGNEISVLLGDCLFARALHLTANYSTTDVCRRVSEATNIVCTGEILQTQRRFDANLTVDQYVDIINQKTGALFAVSCELGALLNGAPATVVKQLRDFGSNLGIAYQIYDDCVDIFGQERQAGKSLGTDVKKGKLTLPFLLLLQHANADRRRELGEIIFHGAPTDRQQVLRLAMSNGVATESLLTVDRYVAQAEANLAGLPVNVYTQTFATLLNVIAGKSRSLLREDVAA